MKTEASFKVSGKAFLDRLPQIALAVIAGSLIRVLIAGKAVLYVHPSMVPWIQLGVFVFVVLVVMAVNVQLTHLTKWQRVAAYGTAALLLCMPSSSLSPSFASNRDAGELLPTVGRGRIQVKGASSQFDLLEWIMAWEGDPTRQKYIGARANIVGFVGEKDGGYTVNRYLVTCCAVDAQLIQLPIRFDPSVQPVSKDSWVALTGTMQSTDSKPELLVTGLTPVSEPSNPYLY